MDLKKSLRRIVTLEVIVDTPASTPKLESPRHPIVAALGFSMAGVFLYAWLQSGRLSDILGALAFAAISPSFYVSPVRMNAPLSESFKLRGVPLPPWAMVSTAVGTLLIFASMAARWWG